MRATLWGMGEIFGTTTHGPAGRWTVYYSPIGRLFIDADSALHALLMENQKHYPTAALMAAHLPEEHGPVGAWLDEYFRAAPPSRPARAGQLAPNSDFPKPPLPLDPSGTDFQKRVWNHLLTICPGHTVTYGEIARALGSSPRAVGGAVGRNPITLIVPCHRVVGASGALTGYAGGVARKRWLLEHERR